MNPNPPPRLIHPEPVTITARTRTPQQRHFPKEALPTTHIP
jgi:hypothetical protein